MLDSTRENALHDERSPEEIQILSRGEKVRICVLAILFAVMALLGMFEKVTLNAEIVLVALISAVLFSRPLIPKTLAFFQEHVQSVKVGVLEIKLVQQQRDHIDELSKRIAELEEQLRGLPAVEEITKPVVIKPDPKAVRRFESAAQRFGGSKEDRILAINEMTFLGAQLGRSFLEEKLRGGTLGERAGAAAALGILDEFEALRPLADALKDESSFVRYRAAKSIRALSLRLDETQIPQFDRELEIAESELREAIQYEENAPTRRMMERAISALRRVRKTS